ncbi:MAG TPA: GGDEF domain-containing protein [Mycobacteriales bacterium]|nr:GGDEF domain-containing protein [Mycobacteriales bacterium]
MLSGLGDGRDAVAGHLLVLRDITERKRTERHLQYLAHYDNVTGLPNRKLFADRLEQALVRARRNGVSLAVLFFDLDRFKVINDSLSHDAGDQTLVAVARRVQLCLRREDTLARFGGDEFCVLLPEISHSGDAAVVAKKILRAMSRPLVVRGRELDVTAASASRSGRRTAVTSARCSTGRTRRCTPRRPGGATASSSRTRS